MKIESLPLDRNYEDITREFEGFGTIKEIRLRITTSYKCWQVWIVFTSHSEALKAYATTLSNGDLDCKLICKTPPNLDVYYPAPKEKPEFEEVSRTPLPPSWLIATVNGERGNLYSFRKFLKTKVGDIENSRIKRFGKNSFLIHAMSDTQAAMILNLSTGSNDMIKQIKPHFNFSYAKGVIFNRDLYDLDEKEILDMCPLYVGKVFKVPRSSMIVLTCYNDFLPHHVVIEGERMEVRPYRQRPLQCYKCYGFGHASRNCGMDFQTCVRCSLIEHGECSRSELCKNCREEHNAKNRNCAYYKLEQEAVIKAANEKTSIGYAKRMLSKTSYSDILKNKRNSGKKSSPEAPRSSREGPRSSPGDPRSSPEDPRSSRRDPLPSPRPTQPSQEGSRPSSRPTKPAQEGSRPSSRPNQPPQEDTRPSSRPSQPSHEGSRPSSRPSQPSKEVPKPSQKTTQSSAEGNNSASEASRLNLRASSLENITIHAEIHNSDQMESETIRKKRVRAPSPQPTSPQSRSADDNLKKPSKSSGKSSSDSQSKKSKTVNSKPSLQRGSEKKTSK